MAEALYRKYRPQVFADVVGQEPIERTLRNALEQDKVSHAYLFTGPRGTGKTTTARLLAKALLCQRGPTADPDGTCEECRMIAEGTHPDVYELDAASRTGVENVREEIISRVQYAPTRGRSKVYIIDEVHMLSPAAFNALLKTLEEPPAHVVFILCTTDSQKVPETIHSRCQRFDFHRIAPESIVTRLGAICVAEGVEFEGEALDLIAQRAEGGLRNALTSLEQIIAFEDGRITLEGAERLLGSIDADDMADIMGLVGRRDVAGCFRWVADFVETGADLAQFARDMAEHARNLYVMVLAGDEAVVEVPETVRASLKEEMQWFGADRASRLLGVLGDLSAELKTSSNPRLSFEIALTRMVRPDSDLTLEALAERVEALESGHSAVAFVAPMPAEAPAPAVSAVPAAAPAPRVPEAADEPACPAAEPAPAFSEPPVEVPPAASASFEPPAAAPASGGPGILANPAALQRIWQAALAEVKKRKQAHGVLFMNAKAHYDEDRGGLRIVFPEEAAFAFNAVQKPEVQDALAQALAKAAGAEVPFTFSQGSLQPSAPVTAPVAAPASQVAPVSDGMGAPASTAPSEAACTPPWEEAATVPPQPSAVPQPSPEPAYAEDPFDDEPPLSVYEDCLPAEEAYGDAPDPVPPLPSQDVSPKEEGSLDEVQALLQNGFGSAVVLKEVDE